MYVCLLKINSNMTDSIPNRDIKLKATTPTTETWKSMEHFNGIMNKINDFFNEKKFCDVSLISKDNVFKIEAHKMILCASSNYFLAMFGGSMREATENEAKLDIDGPLLESVINFIYTSSIELTSETVVEILKTANLLELTPLKVLCSEFIVKHLDSSNCLGIALFAEQYNLAELYKQSEMCVLDNFAQICQDEMFLDLDVDQLSKFISSSDLRVDTEEDVFTCLMSWMDHDRLNREEFMYELLNHIRFPLLTPEFIESSIDPTCKSIKCVRLICKAYKWHLFPELRPLFFTDKHTQLRNFNGMIMAISGWSANAGDLNVGLYCPGLNEWIYKSGISALTIGREDFGSTTFEGKLIIAGGMLTPTKTATDRVDCLDLRTFKWTSLAPLNSKRMCLGMSSLNGYIYVFGGCNGVENLNTVEKYNPSTKKWEFVAPMYSSAIISKNVSVTFNKICVSTLRRVGLSIIKYKHSLYDPETDTWNYDWLQTDDGLLGAGAVSFLGDEFFIAVGRKSLLKYNASIDSREVISINNSLDSSDYTKCEPFGDRMIAYGNNLFQEYNPSRNQWKMMPKFENTRGRVILISVGSYLS